MVEAILLLRRRANKHIHDASFYYTHHSILLYRHYCDRAYKHLIQQKINSIFNNDIEFYSSIDKMRLYDKTKNEKTKNKNLNKKIKEANETNEKK